LVGHTDITGVEAANLPLSRERADQIRAALLRNGVKSASVLPRGVGTSQPLRDESTEEGRRLNRSVTFKITLSPVPAADADAAGAASVN
jgi:outer membrane protein OmpA-like peptidoglycan-associated protein